MHSQKNRTTFTFLNKIPICLVSEKIVIHDCPNDVVVEYEGIEAEASASWTPPTAELLSIDGSVNLERSVSSTGSYDPGDLFPVDSSTTTSTAVEYRFESQDMHKSCIFKVNVTKGIQQNSYSISHYNAL